jgi:hypothetical protein
MKAPEGQRARDATQPSRVAGGRPAAGVAPAGERRDPWVPAAELRRIVREAPADARLLDDLADVRAPLVGDE